MSSEPRINSLEQFAAIEAIRKLTVSRDSKRILFLSITSGPVEAHSVTVVGQESGKRRKEFDSSNSVANAYLLSDGSLLFESDIDGNELNRIQRYAEGKVTGITKEGARCTLIKVDSKEEWAYFLSSERDPMALDTKRVSLKNPDIVEMVYESRDGMMLEDVSDDGRYLAMKKYVPGRQRQPFIFDCHQKTLKAIDTIEAIPTEIDTRDVFGPDNKLYIRDWTDYEFHIMRSYDPSTNSLCLVHEGLWNIELFEISKSGRYHAYTVNADSHLLLRVYDTQTKSHLTIPECDSLFVRTFSFFPDESKIAFTANNCKGPVNIYTFDLKTSSLARWTDTGKNIVSEEKMVRPESIQFKSFDGMEIPAFYYRPSGSGPFPAVFLAHGGPGGQTFQSWDGLTQILLQHNIAVIAVNNRGSSGYGKTFFNLDMRRHGRDDIDDFVWAIKHFSARGLVDDKRTAIMGGSYGGYITMAALCFRPEAFQCGVNIVGVTNWVRTLKSIPPWWNEFRSDLYNYMGNPDTEEEYLKSISPFFNAHLIKKPFLVLQGANDPRVLQAESDDIVAAARKNGVAVEYLLFPDEGHGFTRKQNMLKANEAILSFLRDKLLK